jgi:shikimate kinase
LTTAASHVVLVGLMGTGKTTVGKLLARRLDRPLFDSDAMVEARTGRTVREIWHAEGEDAYRALETGALRDALAATAPSVIAAAGGVVLRPENRAALNDADALVVWLHAAPEVLVHRADTGDHRPLLDADPLGRLRQMALERESLYRAVADLCIDVSQREPAVVADTVLDALEAAP